MRDHRSTMRRYPQERGRDRVFVAVYPPTDLVTVWQAALEPLIPATAGRFVPVEQVHLTLQFVARGQIEHITEAVRHAASGIPAPQTLRATRPILLPQAGARTLPRLLAVEAEISPGLLELQSRLARRLAGTGRADPGDHYLPHLTLCRFKPGGNEAADVDAIEATPLPDEACRSVNVSAISVVRSILRPSGAEHRVVGVVELG